MPLVYRKTAKGVSEIETRAHKLAPRLRSALIMVDGKRSDDELRALIQNQPIETVAWLLENGFIDVMAGDTVPRMLPPGPVTAAVTVPLPLRPAAAPVLPTRPPAPPPVAAPVPFGTQTGPTGAAPRPTVGELDPALEARRREGLRLLVDQLGPAAESVAVRIEKARTLDELRVALSAGAQALNSIRGRDAALAFVARFSDL